MFLLIVGLAFCLVTTPTFAVNNGTNNTNDHNTGSNNTNIYLSTNYNSNTGLTPESAFRTLDTMGVHAIDIAMSNMATQQQKINSIDEEVITKTIDLLYTK